MGQYLRGENYAIDHVLEKPSLPEGVSRVPPGPTQGADVGPQHGACHHLAVWSLQIVEPDVEDYHDVFMTSSSFQPSPVK